MAKFSIPAGTGLIFKSGDTEHLFIDPANSQIVVGGTSPRAVGGVAIASVAASTPQLGTVETIVNFSNAAITLPANTLKVGTMVRVRAGGLYTATTGTENHVFAVRAGATNLCLTGSIDPADNNMWDIDFTFVCRSIGATGTVVGTGVARSGARATVSPSTHFLATGATSVSTTAIDTTVALVLAVSVDRQAAANDLDSMRCDYFVVEISG